MKLTRQVDGTVEIEGTPEEVRALLEPADAIGKMLVQYPPFAPAACPPFMGQVWVGTVRPGWANNAAAAAQPWGASFAWNA